MFRRFYPRLYTDSTFAVDYGALIRKGVSGLIFDLDNTLAPYDMPLPGEEIRALIDKLRGMGFSICILSNNSGGRVKIFADSLGVRYVSKAKKPSPAGVHNALELMGKTTGEIALIGDQMFTDIWCGNRAGAYTILVAPLTGRDEWTVRLKRPFEKIVFTFYKRYSKRREGESAE